MEENTSPQFRFSAEEIARADFRTKIRPLVEAALEARRAELNRPLTMVERLAVVGKVAADESAKIVETLEAQVRESEASA
jgi:hypothetical protein